MKKPSILAIVRFIADSMPYSFWGTKPGEEEKIQTIRKEFADHLYDRKPPKEVMEKLSLPAKELYDAWNSTDKDFLIGLYETPEN